MTVRTLTLSCVTEFIVDCLHKTAPTQENGYPLIRTPNIGRGRFNFDGVHRISQKTYDKWTMRAVPQKNDLIMAREAPVGNVAIIKSDEPHCLGQRTVHIRPNPKFVDPDFLTYFLLAPRQQAALLKNQVGVHVGHVNMKDIRKLPLEDLPPIEEQKKQAQIIAAYDDLIENNKRRIALLEESARQLYKEWFVRFRFPGHEHVKIVDGVPEGWNTKPVSKVCSKFVDGDWIETKDQGGEDFRILQISNIGIDRFVETGNFRFISERTYDRLNCDEVVPGDLIIARMPKHIGRAWLVTGMPWKMVTAVDVTIARNNPSEINQFYLLCHLNSDQHIARCEAGATGATRPRVARKVMGALPIIVPPPALQNEFSEFAHTVHNQKHNLFRQIEQLQQARDLLLPKLMNGEITV